MCQARIVSSDGKFLGPGYHIAVDLKVRPMQLYQIWIWAILSADGYLKPLLCGVAALILLLGVQSCRDV